MEFYGTLGPACRDKNILRNMFEAGMTGVRLNLSHGGLKENGILIEEMRKTAEEMGIVPEILIDLQGPELRIGRLSQELLLEEGEWICFGEGGVPVPEALLKSLCPGDHVLLDDGKLEFLVEGEGEGQKEPESRMMADEGRNAENEPGTGDHVPAYLGRAGSCSGIYARVLRGGRMKSGKSLAVVGKEIPMPTLTAQDLENLILAPSFGVTGVMLPFVRSKEDLLALREALLSSGAGEIRIFAKIENQQGVHAIEELLPYCDQVVIARGDLGNSMPLWQLPGTQKRLAVSCIRAGKPFMVVTELLASMAERAVPTRAEVSDIYNAVCDGASSLMLTGETAAGSYPAEAMEYLVRTASEAMKDCALSGQDGF